jgi:hypothetical protein
LAKTSMERPFVVLTTAVSNRPWSLIDQLVGGNSICGFGHIRFGIGLVWLTILSHVNFWIL